MIKKELFGGNMTMSIPAHAVDVSDLREVPDNQEVFAHQTTDQSLIVELLSHINEPDNEAVRTHYNDLAGSNDASGENNAVVSVELIPTDKLSLTQCSSCLYLMGNQLISKYNESARNKVTIHMALLRIPELETDVVVTLNDPTDISAQSSSSKAVGGMVDNRSHWSAQDFLRAVESLTLVNPAFLNP